MQELTMTCPTCQQLQDLLAGTAEDSERVSLEAHLESCSSCQEAMERLLAGDQPPSWKSLILDEPRDESAEEILERVKQSTPASSLEFNVRRSRSKASGSSAELPPIQIPGVTAVPGYEILGEIGRGGMGVVFKARQTSLNRFVALKQILPGMPIRTNDRARFRAEAEAVARLQHPNIVQIYEVAEHEGGPFFAMEYVDGPSLAEWLNGTPQPALRAATMIETLARAIQHAHERKLVHRDLKPANILLQNIDKETTRQGDKGINALSASFPGYLTPKITDFGLAKRLDDVNQTQRGLIVGTLAYMAPEQASSRSKQVGTAADIYSLGAILYEMLTGRPPFQGESWSETILQVERFDPVPPRRLQPRVPADLETICLKCLSKEPGRRYPSAVGLADDLRRFLEDRPVIARPPSLIYQGRRFARRHKGLVGGTLAVALSLVAGMIASLNFAIGEAEQRKLADSNAQQAVIEAEAAKQARHLALRQAYQARLASGQIALSQRDFTEAAEQLAEAPQELRGWEWHHLRARLLNEQPIRTPLADKYGMDLEFFPAVPFVIKKSGERHPVIDGRTGKVIYDWPKGFPVSVKGEPCIVPYQVGEPLQCINRSGQVRYKGPMIGPNLNAIALSQDATHLVMVWTAGKAKSRIEMYDASTQEKLWESTCPTGYRRPQFSPDGHYLAATWQDNSLRIWHTLTGNMNLLRADGGKVIDLAFSPDSSQLASCSTDTTVHQWDVHTGKHLQTRRGHFGIVYSVEYSSDGKWLLSGGDDSTIRLWPATSNEPAAILRPGIREARRVGFSADGTTLGVIDDVGVVRLIQMPGLPDAGVLRGHTSYVYPVKCSPDGMWIASGGWDDKVRLWDAKTGDAIPGMDILIGGFIAALAISPDSQRMAIWRGDGQMWLWDIYKRPPRKIQNTPGMEGPGTAHGMTISPDGRWLLWGERNRVRRWDLFEGRELFGYPVPMAAIRQVAISPDGNLLAVAGTGFALLDAHSGQVQWENASSSMSVAFSPDNGQIVVGGSDLIVRILDAATGKVKTELRGHTEEIFATVYHPDGSRIASAGRDRVIHIWDSQTGDRLARLQGHTSYVFSLAFSPDGRTLVSGSGDYSVRLWDTHPADDRVQARHELLAAKPEAERLVARWLAEEKDTSKVAERQRAESSPGDPVQRAAWQLLMRKANESRR